MKVINFGQFPPRLWPDIKCEHDGLPAIATIRLKDGTVKRL